MHMTRKMLDYELGRYKRKVADQQKEIQKLKEDICGYEQREDINQAMIAAVIEQAGTVTISRERITEILNNDVHVMVDYDAERMAYTLRLME